jgi:hypothetical protein
MHWDFDDDVPVPGPQLVSYLRLASSPEGTHIEVDQHAVTVEQGAFFRSAWSMVVGRLSQRHQRSALSSGAPPVRVGCG